MGAEETFSKSDVESIRMLVEPSRVSFGESVLGLHSKDESFHKACRPHVVVWPLTAQEISKILILANEKKIPVTPWGAGTSLEGNPIPVEGGIVLDMQQMNRIIEIREKDLQAVVQPGVIYKDLNKRLGDYGLFFPPDPGAAATIGGMVANNASGIRTVRYGSTRDLVLKLEVILPTGEIIRTGSNAVKSSAGYDLTRIFVGSEGTLGVITEVTLRLFGVLEGCIVAIAAFNSVKEATEAVTQIMQAGLSVAGLELLDTETIRVINSDKKLTLDEKPTLFMEFHGTSNDALKMELEFVKEICSCNNSLNFNAGIDREERNRLWEARHGAHESIKRANPGFSLLMVDTAVPISKYSDMIEFSRNKLEECQLRGYIYGHAGSGNLHLDIVGNPEEKGLWELIQRADEAIVYNAIALGGTATGEHGIGIGKRKFMRREHGESVELMKKIKKLLDPNGIMNPGKIFE